MRTPAPLTISLADLAAGGLRLRPAEAVTIARELTLRAHRGELPGIPSATVLRFTSGGGVICEGPVVAGQSVERAARLLESLLPGFDAPPEFRVPGALRLVIARALGTLDLPAYPTLDAFADALARFAADDMATIIRALVRAWRSAADNASLEAADAGDQATTEITVSDIRRARRSTGLRLAEISERSRIPVSLLRELEWGYFVNWPAGQYGRSQLVRYARAAGLDVEVVTRAVWPVLDETVRQRAADAPRVVDGSVVGEDAADEPVPAATGLVRLEHHLPARQGEPRRRPLWLAALAIPALVAIGFVPALWDSSADSDVAAPIARTSRAAAAQSHAADPAPRPPAQEQPPPEVAAERKAPVAQDARPDQPRPVLVPDRSERPVDAMFSPSFASAGSAMFYHAESGDSSALMRADTDTTGAVLRVTSIVDDEAQNFHVRPSPDGSMIAFDSDRDGERAVYIADADGRNVRRVSGAGYAAVPSWSPDGRTLAFVREEADRPRVWNLWLADLETGESRRLTSHPVGQPWGAAWFPDGRRIAYSHEERLVIRSLDGSEERVYNTPRKGHLLRTPAVSPDGRRVMFQVRRDGAWLLDLASGGMRRVLADATAEEFTWSPDGRRVAYHSRKAGGWGVWMMTAK